MPKTSKNWFQNVCFSALSLRAPAQSRAKRMAFWRISFQEIGMDSILAGSSHSSPQSLSRPGQELSRAGVDLDPLALAEVFRHLNDQSGFQGGGLGASGGRVAPHAWRALDDRQLHGNRELGAHRLVGVDQHLGA